MAKSILMPAEKKNSTLTHSLTLSLFGKEDQAGIRKATRCDDVSMIHSASLRNHTNVENKTPEKQAPGHCTCNT